jgi:hypothetical protein
MDIRESTALECLRRFVKAIVQVFGPEYMRMPNELDTARLHESRGFLDMFGSINFSIAWEGMPVWH